ncbi:MAG: M3 family metallopeptidase [Candidatus Azotimanducaceae bacterium]
MEKNNLPNFRDIDTKNILPELNHLIELARSSLEEAIKKKTFTYDSLAALREEVEDNIDNFWSPISHLQAVCNEEALRKVYAEGLLDITKLHTEMDQDLDLFRAYEEIRDSKAFSDLSIPKKKAVTNAIKDFHLTGVNLSTSEKAKLLDLKSSLSTLSTTFSNNVLDSTQEWQKTVTNVEELSGVPKNALSLMSQAALQKGSEGYLVTLDIPTYLAIVTHCDNRDLRKEIYLAYGTRSSKVGPGGERFDNTKIIYKVLEKRRDLAEVLGFKNYAEFSVSKKMAGSPEEVLSFLRELGRKAKPQAEEEMKLVERHAKNNHSLDEIEPWDVAYYSEKLKQDLFEISEELLRPFFPVPRVLEGMFEVARRLFEIDIRENNTLATWHDDVVTFDIKRGGKVVASFYLDLYARENKRGGAWMAECRAKRIRSKGDLQKPVAFLTCNFSGPIGTNSALLSHQEVITLFHEFGHGLHHMLTKVEVASVSGINGVCWDAVELPSQFMENYCWESEALAFISGHNETQEPLPQDVLKKLTAAKNFNSALALVRQIEFALFDMRIHMEFDPEKEGQVANILSEVRDEVSVIKPPDGYWFENSFSHIFAGGYAAGYYSYKWSEVLSADAFSKFLESGIFNRQTGEKFLYSILEKGGSEDAGDLFVEFMGREPSIDALLKQSGISA